MVAATLLATLLALVLCGAMFGFFYAWVCSTMWGLDTADPRVAIDAMLAMNASVRNAVFAPAFFGTAPALWLAAALASRSGARRAAGWLTAAGLVYLLGGNVVTFAVNVPMNEALAAIDAPADPEAASEVWRNYSDRWQLWNQLRAVACGAALLLAAVGLHRLGPPGGVKGQPAAIWLCLRATNALAVSTATAASRQ